jgi:hypothetical protein
MDNEEIVNLSKNLNQTIKGMTLAELRALLGKDGKPGYTLVKGLDYFDGEPGVPQIFRAGEAIGGHRVLMYSQGKVYYFEPGDEENFGKVLGLSAHAANENADVEVLRSGKLINPGWNLTPDKVYYASSNGNISFDPPSSGIVIAAGLSLDSDTLEINFSYEIITV